MSREAHHGVTGEVHPPTEEQLRLRAAADARNEAIQRGVRSPASGTFGKPPTEAERKAYLAKIEKERKGAISHE